MTFLELCQRTRQECGIAGAGPTTVVGQTREMKRLCDWVAQSWVDIQQERTDWRFMRRDFTFNTTAGKQSYPSSVAGYTFKRWINDSFRAYLLSAGVATEVILSQYHDYSSFRDFYLLGSRRLVQGRPLYITIAPDQSLLLGFPPNDVYVVSGQYYSKATLLTADDDEPCLPEDYHMLIVYKAMQKYGRFEAAAEQIAAGKEEYAPLFNRLVTDQTPEIMQCGSLI